MGASRFQMFSTKWEDVPYMFLSVVGFHFMLCEIFYISAFVPTFNTSDIIDACFFYAPYKDKILQMFVGTFYKNIHSQNIPIYVGGRSPCIGNSSHTYHILVSLELDPSASICLQLQNFLKIIIL